MLEIITGSSKNGFYKDIGGDIWERVNENMTTASTHLHGGKTDVVLGEDILLKPSAVNLITKPTMHVQVIIIPPSGMSVTSSAFAKSGAWQYTTTYELEPGTGKDIEVEIRSNQVGNFNVNSRIIYDFGDDHEGDGDHMLTLPITVWAETEPEQTADYRKLKNQVRPDLWRWLRLWDYLWHTYRGKENEENRILQS